MKPSEGQGKSREPSDAQREDVTRTLAEYSAASTSGGRTSLSRIALMWRYLIPAGLFAALVAFLFVGLGRDKETLPSPLIGKRAPQFALPSVDDPVHTVSSSDYAGRTHVLNVWATWCAACHEEHPILLEIARRNEVPIIGVDWNDDRALAQRWLAELGNPYAATVFDGEGRVAIDLGVYLAPQTFLVDASGIIVHKHFGPLTLQAWERDFVPLIRASAGERLDH